MSIYVSSKADLVAMVNVATGQTFVEADLILGKPRAATAAEITTYGKNTALPVNSSPTNTKSVGASVIFYDRLDLKSLENIDLTSSACPDGVALAAWLPVVIGYLNIPFAVAHLVEHSSVMVNGKVNVQLEAIAASHGWFGSATLKFGGYADITTAFNGDTLNGF